MALALDSRQQQPQFSAMSYDPLRFAAPPPAPAAPQQPHFTNPWATSAGQSAGLYGTTPLPASTMGGEPKQYATQGIAMTSSYPSMHLPAPSLATGILPMDINIVDQSGLQFAQDAMGAARPYGASFTTATPSSSMYASAGAPQYAYGYQSDRRSSHPFNTATEAERQSFSDALDASRGMVAMSQSDITPRNIYGVPGSSRPSSDSYGFPSSHSAHSSISSASTYPNYYNSSVSEASIGDYSSASESVDMPSSRTLPRPNGLLAGNLPPAPQSMMGQFSSKVSSSSQKKHKCKICDKRFTRPSSLQTHMYSHTGEKPFACDVEGCGRHFSVVSNLRRHRKVHKDGRDPSSPDDDED